MCGISGFISLDGSRVSNASERLRRMISAISHRGPDGQGYWVSPDGDVGFGHARLSIIDTSSNGAQPMTSPRGTRVVFNGEIYNYKELRRSAVLGGRKFQSSSDTETILSTHESYGKDFLNQLRGMFAIGLWDETRRELILARDRFGIKPLYYTVSDGVLYFASEAKALLPFCKSIEIENSALEEYLTFQSLLGDKTLFKGVSQVMPGESLTVKDGLLTKSTYWNVQYEIDYSKTEDEFTLELHDLFDESMSLHLRSDVEVGAYLSGGVDSSLIASWAARQVGYPLKAFHGRYLEFVGYDESGFASHLAQEAGVELDIHDFTSEGAMTDLRKVIYHLDYPVGGPGALPQYQISREASLLVKVALGGQGGDEIFGGYARYLIGYLEQCLRAAIDGTSKNGNFVVTLESVIPNLGLLREYQPLLQKFWASGLFGPMDERYFQLINRKGDLGNVIRWDFFGESVVFDSYLKIFNDKSAVSKESYFDSMTHYDFKTLLPALLQVEDRMSMAHGLESRVPFLDHRLVEFAATIPADVKFKNGELKRMLRVAFSGYIPPAVAERRDKMGFPVPLTEWAQGPLKKEFAGMMESLRDRNLDFINQSSINSILTDSPRFSRGTWALLSLELWLQAFHGGAVIHS